MAKIDIDFTNDVQVADYNRYNFLASKIGKSTAEENELAALQVAYANYIQFASDFNALETAINTNTSNVSAIPKYPLSSGTSDALVVSGSYFGKGDGESIKWKQNGDNTGAVTLNGNGTGVESLRANDGTVLGAGDLEDGQYYEAIWDSGQGFFVLAPKGGAVNGEIASFEVDTGETVSRGDFVRIIEGKVRQGGLAQSKGTSDLSSLSNAVDFVYDVIQLDDERTLVLYSEVSTSYPHAVVVKNVNGAITIGAEVQIESGRGDNLNGVLVDTDKVVVFYNEIVVASSTRASAEVLTITDTSVSVGSQLSIETGGSGALTTGMVCKMGTNKALAVWSNSSTLRGCVLTISGSSVSNGPIQTLTGTQGQPGCVRLEDDKALVTYEQTPSSVGAVIATISGTSITFNTPINLQTTGGISRTSFGAISNTQVVALINEDDNMFLLNVSGTTITKSDTIALTLDSEAIYNSYIDKIAVIVHDASLNPNYKCDLYDYSATELTLNSTFDIDISTPSTLVNLDNNTFGDIVAGSDDWLANFSLQVKNYNGVAEQAGTATETIDVYI